MTPAAPVAIVTGGTRGIGLAVARRLAGDGHAVVLSGRTAKSVEAASAALREEGFAVRGLAADARRDEDQRALVELAMRDSDASTC